jgi:hypothetical protein
MNIDARRTQLRAIASVPDGIDRLIAIWQRATGRPDGVYPARGTLLIQAIIDAEQSAPDAPDQG